MIMQQRQPKSFCDESNFLNCAYNPDESEQIFQLIPNQTECIYDGCAEYLYRNNIDYTQNSTIQELTFHGKYSLYNSLGYFINLNFSTNITQVFEKLINNTWIDEQTQVIIALAGLYDFRSKRQIQILFQAEMPFDLEILSSSVQISQLSDIGTQDTTQNILFFYFIVIGIMITFRGLLELSYLFSKFALPLFQSVYYTALYVYTIIHLYRMFKSEANDGKTLLFQKSLLQGYLGVEIFGPERFYLNLEFVIIEDFALLILWLMYPFRILKLYSYMYPKTWYRRYLNAIFRTVPSLNNMGFFIFFVYTSGFLPIILLNESNRFQNNQNSLLLFLSRPFADANNELTLGGQASYFNFFFDFLCGFTSIIILIYFCSIIVEAFRKSTILELPYITHNDKDLEENITDINLKVTKFLKEIHKILPKDKKSTLSRSRQIYENNMLDEDFLCDQLQDKKSEKILLVYEIHNSYLDEINRYQEKKNFKKVTQIVINRAKPKNVGVIISQLLQKSQNLKLQNMLTKFKSSQDGYVPIINEMNEDYEIQDFLKQNQNQIEDQGITIRTFYILDQINKFLQMLIKLRPEFLSPNAEQRIRIFFFINSQQVSEDDVYKLLSFLIVNLKNNHLTYPILIFSHHKDWYIEKDKYLTLKKVYKNIFSTLDEQCALQFSLMKTSLLELQTQYAQEQEFQDVKEIPVSDLQENNSSDDEMQTKSDLD